MKESDVLSHMTDAEDHLQPRRKVLTAILGNGDGSTVKVSDRPGYSWIRVHGSQSELAQALNRTTANVHGLQVDVSVSTDRRGGQTAYEVMGIGSNDILTAGGTMAFEPYLPEHHSSHEWSTQARGRDTVNVYPRAFAFGRVYQTSPASMICNVSPIKYAYQTTLKMYQGGQTQDFTASIPAGANTAQLVLVCINGATNALAYETGTAFDWTGWTDAVPPSGVPTAQPGQLVLSCILLYNGMTSITEVDFRYEIRLPWQTLGGGSIMFGTSAERLAVTDKTPYTGMFWFETDTETMYMSNGMYWYSAGTWTLQQDQMLATEELGPITTEDGQEIGIEVEL